jgi:hypothetical protein
MAEDNNKNGRFSITNVLTILGMGAGLLGVWGTLSADNARTKERVAWMSRIKERLGARRWRIGLFSGELPWRDNAPSISCVPAGTYRAIFTNSPRFGRALYLLDRCLLVLVFGFIPLTSWETPKGLPVPAQRLHRSRRKAWMDGQAESCTALSSQPCDAWSPFSEDSPSNLKYEIPYDDPSWHNQSYLAPPGSEPSSAASWACSTARPISM